MDMLRRERGRHVDGREMVEFAEVWLLFASGCVAVRLVCRAGTCNGIMWVGYWAPCFVRVVLPGRGTPTRPPSSRDLLSVPRAPVIAIGMLAVQALPPLSDLFCGCESCIWRIMRTVRPGNKSGVLSVEPARPVAAGTRQGCEEKPDTAIPQCDIPLRGGARCRHAQAAT